MHWNNNWTLHNDYNFRDGFSFYLGSVIETFYKLQTKWRQTGCSRFWLLTSRLTCVYHVLQTIYYFPLMCSTGENGSGTWSGLSSNVLVYVPVCMYWISIIERSDFDQHTAHSGKFIYRTQYWKPLHILCTSMCFITEGIAIKSRVLIIIFS